MYTTPRKKTPAVALHSSKHSELNSVALASDCLMENPRTFPAESG